MTSPLVDAAWQPSALELSRRDLRRRATTRSVLIALLSSLAVAAVIIVVLANTPGWKVVRETFFDPKVALESVGPIFQGLLVNLLVLVIAAVCVALLGTLLAVLRSLRGPVFFPLRLLAAAYTDFFRGVPLLIVLYLVGFGIPALMIFPRMPAMFWGTIALVISYSAYVAEVLRAGMEAVHPSQRVAARSLGLTHGQTLRIVVIPQGVRKVVPALMNDFVSMQKDVGLISVLGAIDAVRAAQLQVAETFNFTPYIVAGLFFVILSWPMIRFTDVVTARLNKREQAGGIV
ncbi:MULTISPECIES: amino acid ABC transporter permease [unclassified Microbacterium]|uniref:amino acid ABC transporter permease n=1 Tax=unclassified Microbacterium TaxID=2609290 RepID=UPI001AD2636C|nr:MULTISPECIES: amino acid ABC transporter permease [unclassified Microbacterium]MBN9158653.1 amino acid ABC transporter permease [Microbacterium sp.]MBS1897668.1 amino acid ABC transporter permease [Actinomycetota bacterium]MBS1899734.1 amino acid ABC transporter permease [Actinomycetota bacterium]